MLWSVKWLLINLREVIWIIKLTAIRDMKFQAHNTDLKLNEYSEV
jgi:hypothetical protein